MANTYSWRISQMEAKIQENELSNVIFMVWWEYIATDNEEHPTTASAQDVQPVEYVEGEPFIPYEDLTKNDVIEWLESSLDMDIIKAKLDDEIIQKKNPVNEYLNPNWN